MEETPVDLSGVLAKPSAPTVCNGFATRSKGVIVAYFGDNPCPLPIARLLASY